MADNEGYRCERKDHFSPVKIDRLLLRAGAHIYGAKLCATSATSAYNELKIENLRMHVLQKLMLLKMLLVMPA